MQACTPFQFKTDERKCFLTHWVVNFWSLLPLALWKQTAPIRPDNRLDSWSIKGRARDVLADISPSETADVGDYKVRGFRRLPRPHSLPKCQLLPSLWEPAQPHRPRCDPVRCFLCSYRQLQGTKAPEAPLLGLAVRARTAALGGLDTMKPSEAAEPCFCTTIRQNPQPKALQKEAKLVFFVLSCLHTH